MKMEETLEQKINHVVEYVLQHGELRNRRNKKRAWRKWEASFRAPDGHDIYPMVHSFHPDYGPDIPNFDIYICLKWEMESYTLTIKDRNCTLFQTVFTRDQYEVSILSGTTINKEICNIVAIADSALYLIRRNPSLKKLNAYLSGSSKFLYE
jgi:hypothetical protein